MHVVQVNCARDSLARTGEDLLDAWPTLAENARAVQNAGATVSVVQASHRDEVWERGGVPFYFVAGHRFFVSAANGFGVSRIARKVKALRPDIIHVNGLGFPLLTRRLCVQAAAVLVQDHGSDPRSRARWLRQWGLARIAGAVFTSHEQALPFFANRTLAAATRVFAIPESSTYFQEGSSQAARSATGVHGNPAVLWIGHLNENKDPLTIIEAFGSALTALPDAHLWCCYKDAPLLGKVRARVSRDARLEGRVHLLGQLDHRSVELLCRAADFFMIGSRRESCGFALMEALACGATPIVADIPSFRALTANGAIGALCRAGDSNAFAGALVSLAARSRDVLRSRATEHFKSRLSFPVLGRNLVAAYEAVAAAHILRDSAQP